MQRARLSKTGDIKGLFVVETPDLVDLVIRDDDDLVKRGRLVHLANIPHHSLICRRIGDSGLVVEDQ